MPASTPGGRWPRSAPAAAPPSPDVFRRPHNPPLPDQIAGRAVREVRPDFAPRRRATARWYRYTVYNGRQRPALFRRFVWQVAEPLDVEAMRTAAEARLGEQRFAAFPPPPPPPR